MEKQHQRFRKLSRKIQIMKAMYENGRKTPLVTERMITIQEIYICTLKYGRGSKTHLSL